MPLERLRVTVPHDLGAKVRALAIARGVTVSTILVEAIAQQIRSAALDRFAMPRNPRRRRSLALSRARGPRGSFGSRR
jgi:post-segregation antitoxin (ccd killing protein)